MSDFENLTIILPTLNEAENIANICELLVNLYSTASIIVSDDQSTDNTQAIVLKLAESNSKIKLLPRVEAEVRGITAAVLDAIQIVETEFFAVIDADLQHPPKVIAELYAEIQKGFDLVSGARLPYKEKQGWHRVFATKISTISAKMLLFFKKQKVADPMSGLFIAKTDLVKNLINSSFERFELAGYKVLFDILRVAPKDMKVSNVYYEFSVRGAGKSKLRPSHALYFFRSLFK